jgi:hypothetical protein
MYQIQDFISYKNIFPQHMAFITSISKEQEPNNFVDAIKKSK